MVRGGGETRRKTAIAFALSFTFALMMLAQPVSAGAMAITVQDPLGDLTLAYDPETAANTKVWGNTTPKAKVGYFDITSLFLSYKAKTYTFGMELAKALPEPGSALPNGCQLVQWLMWIDVEPWNPVYNPTAETLYTVQLTYDGSAYAAELREGIGGVVVATLPFSIDGSKFQLQFSAASIGNLESFWFLPCTVALWGYGAYWDLDSANPGAAPGQVWWDIPWPPQ